MMSSLDMLIILQQSITSLELMSTSWA